MKNTKRIVYVSVCLTVLQLCFCFLMYGQSVDSIVARHIRAIGGTEKWNKVNSIVTRFQVGDGEIKIEGVKWRLNNYGLKSQSTTRGNVISNIWTKEHIWLLENGDVREIALTQITQ